MSLSYQGEIYKLQFSLAETISFPSLKTTLHENKAQTNKQKINDMRHENVNKREPFGFAPKSLGFTHLTYSPRIPQLCRQSVVLFPIFQLHFSALSLLLSHFCWILIWLCCKQTNVSPNVNPSICQCWFHLTVWCLSLEENISEGLVLVHTSGSRENNQSMCLV